MRPPWIGFTDLSLDWESKTVMVGTCSPAAACRGLSSFYWWLGTINRKEISSQCLSVPRHPFLWGRTDVCFLCSLRFQVGHSAELKRSAFRVRSEFLWWRDHWNITFMSIRSFPDLCIVSRSTGIRRISNEIWVCEMNAFMYWYWEL